VEWTNYLWNNNYTTKGEKTLETLKKNLKKEKEKTPCPITTMLLVTILQSKQQQT
jgi:hypothetical protein